MRALLLFFVMVWVSPAVYAGDDCRKALLPSDAAARALVTFWLGSRAEAFRQALPFTAHFGRYSGRTFFSERGVIFPDDLTQADVDGYFDWFRRRLSGTSLADLQDEVIRETLRDHGSPSESLAEVSAINQRRMLRDLSSSEATAAVQESADLAAALDFTFIHRTLWNPERDGALALPLISTREAVHLTGEPGPHTFPFNRIVLGSDHTVHFFPRPVIHGRLLPSEGDQEDHEFSWLELNSQYAARRGMVASYLMWPQHLVGIARIFAPQSLSMIDRYAEIDSLDAEDWAFARPDFLPALARRYLLDFTVSDFRDMCRTRMSHELARMMRLFPEEYHQTVQRIRLRQMTAEEFWRVVFPAERVPLGDPGVRFPFALLMPAAVPVGEMRFVQR